MNVGHVEEPVCGSLPSRDQRFPPVKMGALGGRHCETKTAAGILRKNAFLNYDGQVLIERQTLDYCFQIFLFSYISPSILATLHLITSNRYAVHSGPLDLGPLMFLRAFLKSFCKTCFGFYD